MAATPFANDEAHTAHVYRALLSPRGAPLRVLTVGDGDLSYSVALARAFGPATMTLTATTFVDEDELRRTYTHAGACLDELRARGAVVRHGVDATALGAGGAELGPQDHVFFNHPHLGLGDLQDTAAHAKRHSVLVAHYLASAATVLAPAGYVHLTLCGNQPQCWDPDNHARRLGLVPLFTPHRTTNSPSVWRQSPLSPWVAGLEPRRARPEWAAHSRFRGGRLGSKHWLGWYGYEHRRTAGDIDMRVDKSVELVYVREGSILEGATVETKVEVGAKAEASCVASRVAGSHVCGICGMDWKDADALESHVRALALPDAVVFSGGNGGNGGAAGEEKKQSEFKCSHCNVGLPSRNALFKHLQESCDPTAGHEPGRGGGKPGKVRVALMLGYQGTAFHGCSFNSDEDEQKRPTVEGSVLAAARRAWGDGAVSALTQAVRTEKGVHAFTNLLVLTLSGTALWDEKAFRVELAASGAPVVLLAPVRRLPVGMLAGYMSKIVLKQTYVYAVPYHQVFTLEERQRHLQTGGGGADMDPPTLCITMLPDDVKSSAIEALLEEVGFGNDVVKSVTISVCGGYAEATMVDHATRDRCVRCVDGIDWKGQTLLSLPAAEAAAKRKVHARIRATLKVIVALSRTSDSHNFIGTKSQARNTRPVRPLSRCSSGIQSDLSHARLGKDGSTEGGGGKVGAEEGHVHAVRQGWADTDMVAVRFVAKDFAQEQVRRLAGVLAKVVSGEEDEGYIARCFSADIVDTPLLPARRMWLEHVGLAAKAQAWCAKRVPVEVEQAARLRAIIVGDVRRACGADESP